MVPLIRYPHERPYSAFLHRELSVAWIQQALLLGGQHQLPLDRPEGFDCLEFGCGHGLNLIVNAAAHPEGRFFGVDLNPAHVARATALAAELGLTNVTVVAADLCRFARGRPARGPGHDWPEQVDLVLAYGVAAWVGDGVRQALVEAAASLLRPGGVFQCAYNTHPGWLTRSPLVMLCQEEALRAGGVASAELIRAAARRLEPFTGSAADPLPLGRALGDLPQRLAELPAADPGYLEGEFHAAHQPLYVGAMHRLCGARELTPIGSATLPELFPAMLDPERRALVMGAADPAMGQVLLDLAINQSFRRDLFARGACPPTPARRGRDLDTCTLVLRAGAWPEDGGFDTSLGRMVLEGGFGAALREALAAGPVPLGALASMLGEEPEALLPRLAVLLHAERIALLAAPPGEVPAATRASVEAFNARVLARTTAGEPLGWLLSPLLLQPVPITPLEAFYLPLVDQNLEAGAVAQLVAMGIGLAGGSVLDSQGRPLEDPAEAVDQLIDDWNAFLAQRLPELRRLEVVPPAA